MNEFIDKYEKLKKSSYLINTIGKDFINQGMKLYFDTNDLNVKENVLTKLIEICPNEPAFYYYMGYSFKDINQYKALPYFEKSYELNPNNIENMIDYCNLLYINCETKKIIDMEKINPFGDFLKDIRFLTIIVNSKYKEHYYKDLLGQLLYIIEEKSKYPAITQHDKEWIFSNYLNIGQIYSTLGNSDKSQLYTEKAFDLSKKYDLDITFKMNGLSNLIALANYDYVDNDIYYNKALHINDILPNKKLYTFHSRNNDKIRIGYVSSDFSNHAVSNFISPIIKNHDSRKFEVYLFYNKPIILDEYNKNSLVTCHCIYKQSTRESADLINSCKIDILFDLNGHTENNRLDIFSMNPVPIQISYLGYPNTTGLSSIQYRIVDNISDNPNSLQRYSENLIRMPKCFLLYDSINQTSPIIPRKTKDVIVLGSLNNEKKNSLKLLETWKTILEFCPNTLLLIKLEAHDDLIERQKYYTSKLNVGKDRLLLMTKLTRDGYNKLFSMVDIVLDTFPYSGTTTTCNSLYNSIPVVTLYNKDYHCHNVSSSILKNAGLDELIANTRDEYVCLVKNLVENPSRIDEYKKNIREKFTNSMNVGEFMESYESILKKLYDDYNIKNTVINI